MSFRSALTGMPGAALALLVVASCEGPTAPSPDHPSTASQASGDGTLGLAPSTASEVFEEFNCRDVEEVHFRFSSPGYVRGGDVGLYARYSGVPAGEKLFRIWWDYDNDTTSFQDVRLGEGEDRRDGSGLFNIEYLAEHAYPPVNGPADRLVRAEFILLGKSGNCARNRRITLNVEPPEEEVASAATRPCDGLRFCNLGDGTVRDNVTGLVWLEDANCVGLRRFPIASRNVAALGTGQCGLSDGSVPGDWRLPTLSELESLIDLRFQTPSLSNAGGNAQWSEQNAFSNVFSVFYWTTDPVADCILELPGVSILNFTDGGVRCRWVQFFARSWPVRAP